MNISVAGTGYVGMSLAVLLAQKHRVTAVDIVPERIAAVNARKSPIRDAEIEDFLATKPLDLRATDDWREAYGNAEFVIVATPTNYDPENERNHRKRIQIRDKKNSPKTKWSKNSAIF